MGSKPHCPPMLNTHPYRLPVQSITVPHVIFLQQYLFLLGVNAPCTLSIPIDFRSSLFLFRGWDSCNSISSYHPITDPICSESVSAKTSPRQTISALKSFSTEKPAQESLIPYYYTYIWPFLPELRKKVLFFSPKTSRKVFRRISRGWESGCCLS